MASSISSVSTIFFCTIKLQEGLVGVGEGVGEGVMVGVGLGLSVITGGFVLSPGGAVGVGGGLYVVSHDVLRKLLID